MGGAAIRHRPPLCRRCKHRYVALSVAHFLMVAAFKYRLPPVCWPEPCAQCMTVDAATPGVPVGTAELAGKGTAAEIVLWCVTNFPAAAMNSSTAAG